MKNLKSILAMNSLAMIIISCEKDMGKVKFKNRSVTNKTYDIIWDGGVITTLFPQDDSEEFDVAAGKHSLRFDYSNSGSNACSPGDPVINADELSTFICSQ